ncbi:hypothetical protein HELRODRAFT_109077 [Helobdella robusta]|uniref:PIPK domain-containing protein n=1 Tax=Helobdella robusta TaxID=6412 RepID=T1EEQ3_HELRO|nr:hypothetical protein HELRODRAFT_109077 [Helobdella robusta]ESO10729.1 hypothetical protein HELRODRAFT_109077 [Helobdella robusta]
MTSLTSSSSWVGGTCGIIDRVHYVAHQNDTDDEKSDSKIPSPSSTSSLSSLTTAACKQEGSSVTKSPTNEHIELQFSDSNCKFYCKVLYAQKFEELRRCVMPAEGADFFIHSMSRCVSWLARGGKSGSSFCKTRDNRFILKQMSLKEVQSFNEFAHHYFNYVISSHEKHEASLLARVVGVYKVGLQNAKTGTSLKQDLLVMENLFYAHNIKQIYDLKGSVRNRLINQSDNCPEDVVLLDENLIRAMMDNPLYTHPHCKLVAMTAIAKDTEFLANNLIMDYSLLVGLDEENERLVVGIIDYMRTFTWDKKVEMIFKNSYGSKMPTVVSPDIYRQRFLEAMDRYFLIVPDKWRKMETVKLYNEATSLPT